MACSKQEIERKRLAALEKIRLRNSSHSKTSGCNVLQNNIKTDGVGPLHQNNRQKPKFQPYDRGWAVQGSVTIPVPSSLLSHKIISGTMYMISEHRFEVKESDFSELLINIFKTIPSKSYDGVKRLWNFSLKDYENLQSKLSTLRPNITLGGIPPYVLNEIKQPQIDIPIDLSRIEETLRDKLMPFQTDGVIFGIQRNGRCMIADDMGLGKTFQALAIADYYKQDWPLLIVTTSTMRETWEGKIHELLPSVPMSAIVCVSSGNESQYIADDQAQIVIVSYKMTTLCTSLLINRKFGVIILDESHMLKSLKAKSTGCMIKIAKKSKRIILLSGTPALSRPCELYSQLHLIEPKFFGGFMEFGKRYCAAKKNNFGWDMTGQSNLLELQVLLNKKFLIRRTKEEILTCLKEKSRTTVILNSSYLAANEKTEKSLTQMANTYANKKSVDKHSFLLTYFSESAKVKIPAICKYVSEILKTDEKFLIFAHHKSVIEAICLTLDENRTHYICIDGGTKTSTRNVLVEKFQYNDSCRCAVLSITAANAGITLTSAQLVLFAELHWNPGIITQAESRAHRIGQDGKVNIRYLLAKGTSDDFMWPMLETKLQVLNGIGLSKDTFGNTALTQQKNARMSIENYMDSSATCTPSNSGNNSDNYSQSSIVDASFYEDTEWDELLANVDLE